MKKKKRTFSCDPSVYMLSSIIENSTLCLVTDDPEIAPLFREINRRLHLRMEGGKDLENFEISYISTVFHGYEFTEEEND